MYVPVSFILECKVLDLQDYHQTSTAVEAKSRQGGSHHNSMWKWYRLYVTHDSKKLYNI